MTTPATVLSLVRQHVEAAMIGLGVTMLVAAMFLFYAHGKRVQATADAVAQTEITRTATREATALALRAVTLVEAENDSLRARGDSLNRLANEKHTAANVVNARLSVRADTVSVTTDTGVVAITVPELLAHEIAAGKLATDSAFSAMDRRHDNDSTLVAGLNTQIQLDSVVQNRYRAELAADNAEIDVLKKANSPRWTFAQGTVVGAVVVAVGRVVLAALTDR